MCRRISWNFFRYFSTRATHVNNWDIHFQQQSARFFSPNSASPTTANLTVLNSPSSQCYTPLGSAAADTILNRAPCLTCPTIGDHNCADHPTAPTAAAANFHPFHHHHHHHHTNMPPQQQQHHHHLSAAQLASNKTLMRNHHANMFDSCQK
jgi:hypothetical protein